MPQNSDTFSATETHVPRAWYDSQRAALVRAEGQVVALIARITELYRQLEGKAQRREPAANSPLRTLPLPARTAKRKAAATLEITF